MKEYKPPQTRIKVVESEVQTDYWPQYKILLGLWETFNSMELLRAQVELSADLEFGSLTAAKAIIDLHHAKHKAKYEEKMLDKKHSKEQKTRYITYP